MKEENKRILALLEDVLYEIAVKDMETNGKNRFQFNLQGDDFSYKKTLFFFENLVLPMLYEDEMDKEKAEEIVKNYTKGEKDEKGLYLLPKLFRTNSRISK